MRFISTEFAGLFTQLSELRKLRLLPVRLSAEAIFSELRLFADDSDIVDL